MPKAKYAVSSGFAICMRMVAVRRKRRSRPLPSDSNFCGMRKRRQQLNVSKEIGDLRGEGNALGGIGSCLVELGQPRKGIEAFEEWLPIAQQLGDRVSEHQVYGGLCFAYEALDDPGASIEYANKK